MKQRLMIFLAWISIILLTPYIVTLVWTGKVEGIPAVAEVSNGKIIVDDYEKMTAIELEAFLPGVIAAQIPIEYELEALKCQAVIARTYLYHEMGDRDEAAASSLNINYFSEADLKNMWDKESYPGNLEKLQEAVTATSGMVLQYEGQLIAPMFHLASSGQTRAGDETQPYLNGVESSWDLEIEGYLSISIFDPGDFCRSLGLEVDENIADNIQIIERDEGGYVISIQIGSDIFDGDVFINQLNLDSPCFTVENYDKKIRIISKGIGHGFGFSQWGGNKMAASGYTMEEILTYYYKNIELISE